MSVSRVDGLASGPQGSEQVFEARKRFVRLHAAEAIAKGDLVAFDFTLDSGAEQDPGHGVRIKRADVDDTSNDFLNQVVGVAAEAISSGEIGAVQVSGRCTFCKISGSTDPGLLLKANATAGNGGQAYAGDEIMLPFGMIIKYSGNANAADSDVYLINPMNL